MFFCICWQFYPYIRVFILYHLYIWYISCHFLLKFAFFTFNFLCIYSSLCNGALQNCRWAVPWWYREPNQWVWKEFIWWPELETHEATRTQLISFCAGPAETYGAFHSTGPPTQVKVKQMGGTCDFKFSCVCVRRDQKWSDGPGEGSGRQCEDPPGQHGSLLRHGYCQLQCRWVK